LRQRAVRLEEGLLWTVTIAWVAVSVVI